MYHTLALIDCHAWGRYTQTMDGHGFFGKREQVHGGVGKTMDNHLLAFFVL